MGCIDTPQWHTSTERQYLFTQNPSNNTEAAAKEINATAAPVKRRKSPKRTVGLGALAKALKVSYLDLAELSTVAKNHPVAFLKDVSAAGGFSPVALIAPKNTLNYQGNMLALSVANKGLSNDLEGLRQPKTQALTHSLCQALLGKNLLTPLSLPICDGDGAAFGKLAGCYVVNERRLNGLPREQFAELYQKGFLQHIHAHLQSLTKMKRLLASVA